MYDKGSHLVCAIVTKEFLDFTYNQGNDLISPRNGDNRVASVRCITFFYRSIRNGIKNSL